MASYNKVMLMGNLTEDPELKALQSGTSVTDMRLAVSEKYKTKDGQDQETVVYVDIVAWGRQAETCKEYLSKGSPIFVEGRLQLDTWEKDGQKRSKIRVKADRVQFMNAKSDGQVSAQPSSAKKPAQVSEEPDASFNPDEFDKEPLPF